MSNRASGTCGWSIPRRTLEVLRLESHRWIPAGVFGSHDKARVEPFQDIEIDLGDLWLETG